MTSKVYLSNQLRHERLQPLHSPPHKYRFQSLPSFSEFISFTFPKCELHRQHVEQKGMVALSKLLSSSSTTISGREVASQKPVSVFVKSLNQNNESDMKHIAGLDSRNRTSLTKVQVCENSNGRKETPIRTTRSISVLHPIPLDNDQGSSLATTCSNQHDSFRVTEKTAKETTQRGRNYANATRLYDCPFCQLVFMYQKHLILHVKEKHDQKKPFGCPRDGCWQRFGGLGDMNRHVKTVHDGEKRFSCDLCARCFSRRSGLKRHAYHVHGEND